MKQLAAWQQWALLAIGNAVGWSLLGIGFHDGWAWFMAIALTAICTGRAINAYAKARR
jgi:hypothetical protein